MAAKKKRKSTARPLSKTLTAAEAADVVGKKCSKEAIRKALASGELEGRDMGGSVGWVTTEDAVLRFIEKGNKTTAA